MRHHKRDKQKDHAGLLALVLLLVVFAGIAFLVASPMPLHSGAERSIAASSQRSQSDSSLNQIEDAFYGSMVNVSFTGQTRGTVKADTNCKPVQNGLTNCIAIITGADGKELDFNYSHDMSTQSCLASGDLVTIVLLSDGTVKIIRG